MKEMLILSGPPFPKKNEKNMNFFKKKRKTDLTNEKKALY